MWTPLVPADEEDRVADLRRLDVLLTAPEAPLDRVTQELARIFGVPGAFISFIDEDTQYFKSEVGLSDRFAATRTEPREMSLCSYVVGTNEPLIVEDLSQDERFRDNPAVAEHGVRFYAGAPLRGEAGHAVGSLCIVDREPRSIGVREQRMLQLLAEGVMAQVRLQSASRQLLERSMDVERGLRDAVNVQRFLLPDPLVEGDGWRVEHIYRPVEHLGGDLVDIHPREGGGWAALVADVTGHGASAALMAAMTKTAFVRAVHDVDSPGAALASMNRELMAFAPPGRFVTAQVLLLGRGGDGATIASAGHPYALLSRNGATSPLETDNGLPLLVDQDAAFPDLALPTLAADDAVLLYTDGAIEAANGEGRQLGIAGLRDIVGSLAVSGGLALRATMGAVLEHAGRQLTDDVALLQVARLG